MSTSATHREITVFEAVQHIINGDDWTVVQVRGGEVRAFAASKRGGRDAECVARWLVLGGSDAAAKLNE